MMRIGIFGGTFDPPHNGHLALAKACAEELSLEEVMFVPAAQNPMKSVGAKASGPDRLEMVQLLTASNPMFSVSDMELERGGQSYTVDTLSDLQMVRPAEYWFLLGIDALRDLPNWRQPDKILRLARIGVVIRPSMAETEAVMRINQTYRERIDVVRMPPQDVSSTELRNRIARGQTIKPFVPDAVLAYIEEKRLYQD